MSGTREEASQKKGSNEPTVLGESAADTEQRDGIGAKPGEQAVEDAQRC